MSTAEELFGSRGPLAREIFGFETRPAQTRMAQLVLMAAEAGRPLLVEAATGTGKTLAYLLPLLHTKKRVIVSTATKALQGQIVSKDLPLLRKVLSHPFKAAILKGRGNYLCQYRHRLFVMKNRNLSPLDRKWIAIVQGWAEKTATGDRDELEGMPERLSFWPQIHADGETCLGRTCPDAKGCFLALARARAMQADLVVVNHYLFFADLAVKEGGFGEILPRVDVVVFDEAHRIPDIVTQFFGWEISTHQFHELSRDCREQMETASQQDTELEEGLKRLDAATQNLRLAFPQEDQRGGVSVQEMNQEPGRALMAVEGMLHQIMNIMEPLKTSISGLGACMRRAEEMLTTAGKIRVLEGPDRVHWFETRGRGLFLTASPLETGPTLRDLLYPSADCHIFTSATLATGQGEDGFSFLATQLGLAPGQAISERLPYPFDYGSRTLLYVPTSLPQPQDPAFSQAAIQEILRLLEWSGGRALLLFTSLRMLNMVRDGLRPRVTFPLLVQGESSKAALLKEFTQSISSVLLGLASFWEGVDVPGESLSMVVIDRLPFASPGDPLVAARSKWMESKNMNPFYEMYVPKAVLSLKQGLGRLLRRQSDRGVLVVLDTRLTDKWYGRHFLKGLPPAPLTRDPEAVRRFFL